MRAPFLTALLLALLAGPALSFPPLPKPKDKTAGAKDSAEGTWEMTRMERGGAGGVAAVKYTMKVKIERGKFTQTLNLNGKDMATAPSVITFDTTKTPAWFEVKSPPVAGRPAFVRMKGIYKVDGDALTWVYAVGNGDRPKKVGGDLDAAHVRMTLKRVKQ